MVSTYGYITVAVLESFAGVDYSGINAKYTDSLIEAQITLAEEIINTLTNTTFTGAVTDGVRSAAKILSKRLMNNLLIVDGYGKDGEVITPNIIDELVLNLIKQNDDVSVSSLPMNGPDPDYSRSRWLR